MSANRQSATVPDVMSAEEIAALKSAGYGAGDAGDFLGLSPGEREKVNLSLAVTRALLAARKRAGITQAELAKRIGSSQPRVAMIENGSSGVSLDLVFLAYFAVGGLLEDVLKEYGELKGREAELRGRIDEADKIVKAGKAKVPAERIGPVYVPPKKTVCAVPMPKIKEAKKVPYIQTGVPARPAKKSKVIRIPAPVPRKRNLLTGT